MLCEATSEVIMTQIKFDNVECVHKGGFFGEDRMEFKISETDDKVLDIRAKRLTSDKKEPKLYWFQKWRWVKVQYTGKDNETRWMVLNKNSLKKHLRINLKKGNVILHISSHLKKSYIKTPEYLGRVKEVCKSKLEALKIDAEKTEELAKELSELIQHKSLVPWYQRGESKLAISPFESQWITNHPTPTFTILSDERTNKKTVYFELKLIKKEKGKKEEFIVKKEIDYQELIDEID